MGQPERQKIGLRDAISIGIGGMVGGGIFAVLGLAVSLAKGATPIAFLFAGILALITAQSYQKLSLAYPDRGGTVRFINEGFGINVFSGGMNNLLWMCYVIMLSLYASAFGSYAPNLFPLITNSDLAFHIYSSAIIIIATFINYYSIAVVGKVESFAVITKLIILIGFVMLGAYGLIGNENIGQLSIDNWEDPLSIIGGGMVIFVAYEGFELIANAAPDIKNPKVNIPKAYLYSVVFVIFLYVVIAAVTVGSLPFETIGQAEDYVLAEAGKPILGQAGFTIITIAALISTFSAINASLYGGSRVSYEIAQDDELPHELTGKLWQQPIGLAITSFLTLMAVNTLELEAISTAGSIGFLLIFSLVNLIAFLKRKEINSSSFLTLSGFILGMLATGILTVQQLNQNRTGVLVSLGILTLCFLLEMIYKKWEANNSRKTI